MSVSVQEYDRLLGFERRVSDAFFELSSRRDEDVVGDRLVQISGLILDVLSFIDHLAIPGIEELSQRRQVLLGKLISGKAGVEVIEHVHGMLADIRRHFSVARRHFGGLPGLDLLAIDDDFEVVRTVLNRHPELSWMTGDVQITPEQSLVSDGKKSIGERLFPTLSKEEVKEFDTTL